MPAPSKVLHVLALLGKTEATYGTAATLTTTDGILLQYADKNVGAPVTLDYAFGGEMGPSVSGLTTSPRVAASGRSMRGDLPMRFRGPNGTYNATTLPSLHLPLLWGGFNSTATNGSILYTPTPPGTGYASGTVEMYARNEKWVGSGVLTNPTFAFDGPAPPIWTFGARGIAHALPTDANPPAVTYPSLPVVPLASGATFTLGSFTAGAVYSGSWDLGRDIDGGARVPTTGGGAHLGFVPSMRNPVLKVLLEATAFTGSPYHTATLMDPFVLRELATRLPVLFRTAVGTTAGGSIALSGSYGQIIDVVPQNNGPTAMVELSVAFTPSVDGANDDIQIVTA